MTLAASNPTTTITFGSALSSILSRSSNTPERGGGLPAADDIAEELRAGTESESESQFHRLPNAAPNFSSTCLEVFRK